MTAAELEPIGDAEPEDAWQADDPVVVLLDNVARRLARYFGITTILEGDPIRAELVRRLELLKVLTDDIRRRRAELTDDQELRLELCIEDLYTLRLRLEAVADG